MSEKYPRIRVVLRIEGEDVVVLRESVNITFYFRRSHQEIVKGITRALDIYAQAVGTKALSWYTDYEGYWQELDEQSWAAYCQEHLGHRVARIRLYGNANPTGYGFEYQGWNLDDMPFHRADNAVSAVAFWLPTEYLEAQGPGRVRELALELAEKLPFDSGHAGLSFDFWGWMQSNTSVIQEKMARHPGFGLPELDKLSNSLGLRISRPAWLTFLGQPVLGELGGASGLRARLHSPNTTVQELDGGRVVVTLGKEPEAGDVEQGDTLPHYHELARVLESWLYVHQGRWGNLAEAEIRRWERRFLD